MRGRDVDFKLRGKIDPVVVAVIAQIAEINHTNMKAIAELAQMQDKTIDLVQQFSNVAENMKQRTDQMLRATQQQQDAADGDENS
jgi:hypothetical protein